MTVKKKKEKKLNKIGNDERNSNNDKSNKIKNNGENANEKDGGFNKPNNGSDIINNIQNEESITKSYSIHISIKIKVIIYYAQIAMIIILL